MEKIYETDKNILIIGTGAISEEIASHYKHKTITSFRKIKRISRYRYEKIYIVGYDFSTYDIDYNEYYYKNITKIIRILFKYKYIYKTQLIYINTIRNRDLFTNSRYSYAKHKLAKKLSGRNFKINNIQMPSIINKGKILINGGSIIRFLANLTIRIKPIKTIDIKKINKYIEKKIKFKKSSICKPAHGIKLSKPRYQILDRIYRVIYG